MTALRYAIVLALALALMSVLPSPAAQAHAIVDPTPCSWTATTQPNLENCPFDQARIAPPAASRLASPTTVGNTDPVSNDFDRTPVSSTIDITPNNDGIMMISGAAHVD